MLHLCDGGIIRKLLSNLDEYGKKKHIFKDYMNAEHILPPER